MPITPFTHSACPATPTYRLLGHRGARAEALENSKIGFAQVQQRCPALAGVEFDVQLTADNQLVVVHDADLQRLSGLQSLIRHKTLAELVFIGQSDWGRFASTYNPQFIYQPILPLRDLLPFLVGYTHIELEVKTHPATHYQALAKAVFETLNQPSWQNLPITMTSFDTDFLSAWQNRFQSKLPFNTGLLLAANITLASEIAFLPSHIHNHSHSHSHSQSHHCQITEVCNLACRLGCVQIGVEVGLISPDLITIAHRYGLQVTAWTVNDIHEARQLITWQIDTIITDYPSYFLAKLNNLV